MFVAMLVYLVLVLIRPQDYPAMVDANLLPWQPVALIVAALFWLLSVRKRFDAPQYLLLVAFFLVLMFSHVVNGWFGGALEQLNKFAPTVLAFVVLANATDTRRRVRVVMGMFATCAAVLALHGIEQVQTGVGWTGIGLSQETRIQYVGIFNDPNDLGMLFVICLPMAVYLARSTGWSRLLWWLVAGTIVYGIVLTDSRGTLLAALALLGVYTWWRRGTLFAGALGAAALAVLMALPSRVQEEGLTDDSAMGRVESWYEGLQMFREHPLFGVGPDMYSDLYRLTAHNSFVLVLAETGIVGFTVWLAFVGYCFRMMLVALRQPPQAVLEAVGQGGPRAEGGEPGAAPESDQDAVDQEAVDPEAVDAWFKDRAIALTLLLSLTGCFVAAFFLSRSYVVILYLLTALVVAHYGAMRRQDDALPAFALQADVVRWPVYAAGFVVGLYLVVKVMLAVGG